MILIVDFGSQTTHLIGRRLKELGNEVKIINPDNALDEIAESSPHGIILSGGPASVYEKNAPLVDKEIFDCGIPILGICYGEQLMSYLLGGEVKPGTKKEYGPATLRIQKDQGVPLFWELPDRFGVWMSHGDEVIKPPDGFKSYGLTETIPHAVIANLDKRQFGIQFHPEVIHTQFGEQIFKNFLNICGLRSIKRRIDNEFIGNIVKDVKDSIGKDKAVCALSGGVDSSVAAVLVHRAIGKRLVSIYIDSGLMRKDETENLRRVFQKHYKMNIRVIDAKDEFLQGLKGVTDPERKRKIIGKIFIQVFEREAKKINAKFLVQGTIYPDVIESAGSKHAQKIKSHHNVAGLPSGMTLILIEPVRNFYKDEVRHIGKILGLPASITQRQPFPGPGLAVRIIGEVTEYKLRILREADAIVREEIEKNRLDLWQAFAIFTGIKTTGVRGDARVYGETIAIRAIEAQDAMSAEFAKLPYRLLRAISVRIVNEIEEVNRVLYDITNKPPATMEWE